MNIYMGFVVFDVGSGASSKDDSHFSKGSAFTNLRPGDSRD